jgi:hypothetical protein
MTTQLECAEFTLFDQRELTIQAQEIGDTILQVSQLVIDFASIYRVPRFCINRRENDVEHSFMLALGGIEVIRQHFPGLDPGLGGQLALVHDMPEIKTGDVATFKIGDKQLKEKHANEKRQLPGLLKELPPHIADLVVIYEEQELPEAKVIAHLDKDLPNAVNITGAGLAVMEEDYQVTSVEQFLKQNLENEKRYRERFPDPHHEVLHMAHSYLANKFALQFEEV